MFGELWKRTSVVVVGAAHLVGKGNVVELLERHGFVPEPVATP